MSGGLYSRGILERGDFGRGGFVLGGYCPGGYCPDTLGMKHMHPLSSAVKGGYCMRMRITGV